MIPKSIIEDAKKIEAGTDPWAARRIARAILEQAEKPDEAEGLKAKLAKAEKALEKADLMRVLCFCHQAHSGTCPHCRAYDDARSPSPASPAEPAKPQAQTEPSHVAVKQRERAERAEAELSRVKEERDAESKRVVELLAQENWNRERRCREQHGWAISHQEQAAELAKLKKLVEEWKRFGGRIRQEALPINLLDWAYALSRQPQEQPVSKEPAPLDLKVQADAMRGHAWLRRFRQGNNSLSGMACKDIAGYVDRLLDLCGACPWIDPTPEPAPETAAPAFKVGQMVRVKPKRSSTLEYHFMGEVGEIATDEGMATYCVKFDGRDWQPVYPAEALELLPAAPHPVDEQTNSPSPSSAASP